MKVAFMLLPGINNYLLSFIKCKSSADDFRHLLHLNWSTCKVKVLAAESSIEAIKAQSKKGAVHYEVGWVENI